MLANPPSRRTWQEDKAWTDRLIPQMKQLLGTHLISEAPADEDMRHNTDLIVLVLGGARFACRVRDYKYYVDPLHPDYRDQFTIRAGRPNNTSTELDKILYEGWGHYFLYGFANQQRTELLAYLLGNLRVFRRWYIRYMREHRREPGILIPNLDGSSEFRVFNIAEMPTEFVIHREVPTENTPADDIPF